MNKVTIIEKLANMPHFCTAKLMRLFAQDELLKKAFQNNAGNKLRDAIAGGKYLPHTTRAIHDQL